METVSRTLPTVAHGDVEGAGREERDDGDDPVQHALIDLRQAPLEGELLPQQADDMREPVIQRPCAIER